MYLKPNQRIISGYVKNLRFENPTKEDGPILADFYFFDSEKTDFVLVIFKDAKEYALCKNLASLMMRDDFFEKHLATFLVQKFTNSEELKVLSFGNDIVYMENIDVVKRYNDLCFCKKRSVVNEQLDYYFNVLKIKVSRPKMGKLLCELNPICQKQDNGRFSLVDKVAKPILLQKINEYYKD